MIEEKSIKTKYSEGVERVYTYQIISNCEENIIEYGIEARREDKSEGDIIKVEKKQIKNISSDQDRMDEIINLLSRNQVSPIHLQDILSDYIDRYVS